MTCLLRKGQIRHHHPLSSLWLNYQWERPMLVTFQLISPVKNAEREPKSAHEPLLPATETSLRPIMSEFRQRLGHVQACCVSQ